MQNRKSTLYFIVKLAPCCPRQSQNGENGLGAEKRTFFGFFFRCTSTHRGATFLSLSKFHIFSRSENSWGDKVALQTTNNNNERTPQTIIRPRQDSQNPRANKGKCFAFNRLFIIFMIDRSSMIHNVRPSAVPPSVRPEPYNLPN